MPLSCSKHQGCPPNLQPRTSTPSEMPRRILPPLTVGWSVASSWTRRARPESYCVPKSAAEVAAASKASQSSNGRRSAYRGSGLKRSSAVEQQQRSVVMALHGSQHQRCAATLRTLRAFNQPKATVTRAMALRLVSHSHPGRIILGFSADQRDTRPTLFLASRSEPRSNSSRTTSQCPS